MLLALPFKGGKPDLDAITVASVRLADFGIAKQLGIGGLPTDMPSKSSAGREAAMQANLALQGDGPSPGVTTADLATAFGTGSGSGDLRRSRSSLSSLSGSRDSLSLSGDLGSTPGGSSLSSRSGSRRRINSMSRTAKRRTYSHCGTQDYIAPEVMVGNGYNIEVDLWSTGVVMYVLLAGFPPDWEEDGCGGVVVDFPSPYFDHVSSEAKDLVQRMLVNDATSRISAAQALQVRDAGHARAFSPRCLLQRSPAGSACPPPPLLGTAPVVLGRTARILPLLRNEGTRAPA